MRTCFISGCERTKTITAQRLRLRLRLRLRSQQFTCTNLRQSMEIAETCLLIRGRLTLCTQYISSPLRIHQPLPSHRLAEPIIAGHQATVTALFHGKRAFEPVLSHPSSGGRGIYMSDNTERRRCRTCALVLALFHPGGSGSLTICLGLQTLMCQGMIKHIQMAAFARASPVSH